MKAKLVFLAISFFLFTYVEAQNTFQKYFGTQAGIDYVRKIASTSDGGFVTTGYTNSYGKGDKDVFLAKFNSRAEIQWSKTYGAEGHDEAISVIETSDGGFLLLGYTWSSTYGENDIYVIKTASDGSMTWNKTYGGSKKEIAWDAMELDGQKYLIMCKTESFSHGLEDVCLMRINATGDIEFAKSYGGHQNDWCYNMRKANDGDYLLIGTTYTYGSGGHDMLFLKVDTDGNLVEAKVIGDADENFAYCVAQDGMGNYLIGGKSTKNSDQQAALIKLNANFQISWQTKFGNSEDDVIMNIMPTDENGYYVAGWTKSFGSGSRDVFLSNLTSAGSMNWLKAYGGEDDDAMPQKSSFLKDNRITIAAVTKSQTVNTFRTREWDGYLIRAKLDGSTGCYEIHYTPETAAMNLNMSDVSSTIGVMNANFKSSTIGEELDAAFVPISLCFTHIEEIETSTSEMSASSPFQHELIVRFSENKRDHQQIVVRDGLGRKVYQKEIAQGQPSELHIPTSSWTSGLYIIESISNQGKTTLKVLKNN
jgi:hypothetical protein